jgi:hypothetical protein
MGGSSPKQTESFDREAASQRAGVVREQWEDYKTRFQPWEKQMIAFADNPQVEANAVSRARGGTNRQYASGLGEYSRNMSRLGQSGKLNDTEDKQLAIGRTQSLAQATNDARRYTQDRKEKMQTQGLGAAASQVRV